MNKQFFQKVLPTQGRICVVGIKEGAVRPKFFEDIDPAIEQMETFDKDDFNTFFALGTFEGMKRTANACIFMRSFFVDLDCGEDKPYTNWEDGLVDLHRFVSSLDLPAPIIVNSGNGIHAYWPFVDEIPAQIWKPYAEKFKQLCLDNGLKIDESVTADAARILRVPGSRNLKRDPLPVEVIQDAEPTEFDSWVEFLGVIEEKFDLTKVEKGLDEESKALYEKLNGNFEFDFATIAVASLEGNGCAQIKHIIENQASCPEPLWYAGISVAARCRDASEAIHAMSNEHPDYNFDETERKAAQSLSEANWAHGCDAFAKENAAGCAGCPHRTRLGKLGPIGLGKVLRIAPAPQPEVFKEEASNDQAVSYETESVREEAPTKMVQFPDFLFPYSAGVNGGIYWTPPRRTSKDGTVIQDDPQLLIPFTVYPVERMNSAIEGATLLMVAELPQDGRKEFLLKIRDISALDRLKAILADNSIPFEPAHAPKISSYLMKWVNYLANNRKASEMRMQQGWTDDTYTGFALGTNEYLASGEVLHTPPTSRSRNVVRHIHESGTLDGWKNIMKMFGDPGYEWHAFAVLCGFASPLMEFTNVNGVILSLYGESGFGKTGALYGALSIYGHPERLSVYDATSNALISRMITCKNIVYGLDEQGNRAGDVISHLAHNISSGQPKLRMSGSDNAERDVAFVTKLIAILTTNHRMSDIMSLYKGDTKAEELRILEPYLRRPNVPGYELTAERGLEMFEMLKTHYGHAGPIYIKQLLKLGSVYLRNETKRRFIEFGERFTSKSEYRYLGNLVSLTRMAAEIANDLELLDWDLDRIYAVIEKDFESIVSGNQDEENDRAENILGDFISKNVHNTLVIKDHKIVGEPKMGLYIRAEVDENLIWISSSAIKDHLKSMRLSTSWFEERLKKNGMLICKEKKQMAAGWKSGLGQTNIQAYRLKMSLEHLFKDEKAEQQAA